MISHTNHPATHAANVHPFTVGKPMSQPSPHFRKSSFAMV